MRYVPKDNPEARRLLWRGGPTWGEAITFAGVVVAFGGVFVALHGTGQQGDQFQAEQQRQRIIDCQKAVGRLEDTTETVYSFARLNDRPDEEVRLSTVIAAWEQVRSARRVVGYQCGRLAEDLQLNGSPPPLPENYLHHANPNLIAFRGEVNEFAHGVLFQLEELEADL